MAQDPAELARLIEQLRESRWFRRIDPPVWDDLTPRLRDGPPSLYS